MRIGGRSGGSEESGVNKGRGVEIRCRDVVESDESKRLENLR